MDTFESYLSEKLINRLVNKKSFCWNNGEPELMKIKKGEYTSYRVPRFITKIVYPSNKDRDYSVTVYVHYIEYLINKKVDTEKYTIDTFADYQRLYTQILKDYHIETEVNRFYENFLRRKKSKYDRRTVTL